MAKAQKNNADSGTRGRTGGNRTGGRTGGNRTGGRTGGNRTGGRTRGRTGSNEGEETEGARKAASEWPYSGSYWPSGWYISINL